MNNLKYLSNINLKSDKTEEAVFPEQIRLKLMSMDVAHRGQTLKYKKRILEFLMGISTFYETYCKCLPFNFQKTASVGTGRLLISTCTSPILIGP